MSKYDRQMPGEASDDEMNTKPDPTLDEMAREVLEWCGWDIANRVGPDGNRWRVRPDLKHSVDAHILRVWPKMTAEQKGMVYMEVFVFLNFLNETVEQTAQALTRAAWRAIKEAADAEK